MDFSRLWELRRGVTHLNHGSFGAVPLTVARAQSKWQRAYRVNPMEFFNRRLEPAWYAARARVSKWLETDASNIALCENATAAMNELASWFPLTDGDEVLLTDHEYGAVKRIWRRACQRAGAHCATVQLPLPMNDASRVVETIQRACNARTRLLVVSHITSPTAIILPVDEICTALKRRNVAVCVDGPHAILQSPVRFEQLGCDFYTASCHKWLCAPPGSGFLFAHPNWHERIEPLRLSWGRLAPNRPEHWSDELLWTGTRDFSAYLSIPTAIKLFESLGVAQVDALNHQRARYARERLLAMEGTEPLTPDARQWYGWMVGVWLPQGDHTTLQERLWRRHRIEIPIIQFAGRWLVRVSCHLYNTRDDIDQLLDALHRELD